MAANIRPNGKARHDGDGWYHADPEILSKQLDGFLSLVPDSINGTKLPIPQARVIIAPHAGYTYSGKCAAWAYKAFDVSKAKRVFVLGPSHTYYCRGCAFSSFSEYATPLGNLVVDTEVTTRLRSANLGSVNVDDSDDGLLPEMPKYNEQREHSLEMHMPYLFKIFSRTFASPQDYPKIVPILIGDNGLEDEAEIGRMLLPYLKDPSNAFVVSSDFCHWGASFSYRPYCPTGDITKIQRLRDTTPAGPPIYETIQLLDDLAMDAIKTGRHAEFVGNLAKTGNTVCGRHPIGVMMAALEALAEEAAAKEDTTKHKYIFNIVQYERSSEVRDASDFSVSYVSAYALA